MGSRDRAEAARPTQQRHVLPAMRGRILARDGTVLACDEPLTSLALDYRWLEDPPDPNWLHRLARSHLTSAERRHPERVAAEESRLLAQREELHGRLAALCQLSPVLWRSRCARIQVHVQDIADRVNRRAATSRPAESTVPAAESWLAAAGRKLWNGLVQGEPAVGPAPVIVVAEQLQDHVVCDGLSVEAVAEIEGHPERYPGVRLVRDSRRTYPAAAFAAHLLGFVGSGAGRAGRAGVELHYEALLGGADGLAIDTLDRHGRVLGSRVERAAVAGHDLRLTIDLAAQRRRSSARHGAGSAADANGRGFNS